MAGLWVLRLMAKDTDKILESMDSNTCGGTTMGSGGRGMCQCTRTVKNPGEVCDSCKKHWHVYK